jgi:transcriptional regulator with XRE-family HTH domain
MRLTSGDDLRDRRKAAGLTQTQLAQRAGIGRHAVSYWECKGAGRVHGWAVNRMCEAMGFDPLPHYRTHNARAGGWGLSGVDRIEAMLEAEVARKLAEWRAREAVRAARRRVTCGASTRKETACRNKSEPGKRRCKFHGGKSTGPRTPEGRARIAEAQRRRWRNAT